MSMKKLATGGFTLIEAMIAVTILTFAIAGPLTSASRALVATEVARDQLTASYLAQEGIEYVRAMRDDEYLAAYKVGGANVSTTAWTNFISGSDAASITSCRATTCTLDPAALGGMGHQSGDSLQQCSLSGTPHPVCDPLYPSATTGVYTLTPNPNYTQTRFTRTIQAIDISGYPNDEEIVSTVTWSFHNTPYTVTVTDHLTPWQ
jgi:Tfp pilus assembly protein PilV